MVHVTAETVIGLLIPHLHMFAEKAEGPRTWLARTSMMVLDVALG